MSKQTQGVNIAHCTRCGLKHARPVGARCKTNLNVSAPAFTDALGEEQPQDQGSNLHPAGSNIVTTQSSTIKDPSSQVESKLDLILQKMHELENKNSRLEKRLDEQSMSAGSKPQPAHSSPKRSHRCSARGDPGFHRKRRMVNMRKQVTGDDSSDEDFTDLSHPRASSTQMSTLSDNETSKEMPSLQFLKEDEKIQKKVQKQLERLQGQPRGTTTSGNKTIKSGLHRAGDNAIKVEIPWPHHHCFPGQGGNLPDYKDLSPIQFMIGFMGCIQQEHSNTVRSNMLEYGRHLLQDTLETNWATARHAHLVLLQDIERGKCSWRRQDQIEKIRIRNTARVISQKNGTAPKTAKTSSKDKVCFDFNANTCKFASDHVVDGHIMKHACSYCHKQVGKLFYHKLQDCIRRRAPDAEKDNSKNS